MIDEDKIEETIQNRLISLSLLTKYLVHVWTIQNIQIRFRFDENQNRYEAPRKYANLQPQQKHRKPFFNVSTRMNHLQIQVEIINFATSFPVFAT